MRTAILLLAVLCLCLVPKSASAQCSGFSIGVTCSASTKPTVYVDFGLPKAAPDTRIPQVDTHRATLPMVIRTPGPIDCRMVKPIDPQFKSAMRIAAADPKVQLPMRIVQTSTCSPR